LAACGTGLWCHVKGFFSGVVTQQGIACTQAAGSTTIPNSISPCCCIKVQTEVTGQITDNASAVYCDIKKDLTWLWKTLETYFVLIVIILAIFLFLYVVLKSE
jgi:hypothetical protein